jgi:DNA-binding transcriptional ArsR family regulator
MARPIRPPTLYPSAWAILRFLSDRCDEHGATIVSRSELAEAIGVSEFATRQALKRLTYLGMVEIRRNSTPSGKLLKNTLILLQPGE